MSRRRPSHLVTLAGVNVSKPSTTLPEENDERCASDDVDAEPSLDLVDHPDQERWTDGGEASGTDRELDPIDDVPAWTVAQQADRAQGRRIADELRAQAYGTCAAPCPASWRSCGTCRAPSSAIPPRSCISSGTPPAR